MTGNRFRANGPAGHGTRRPASDGSVPGAPGYGCEPRPPPISPEIVARFERGLRNHSAWMVAEDFVLAQPVVSFGIEQIHERADPPAGVLACRDDQPVSARLPGRLPGDNHVAWSCDFVRVGGLAS